MGGANYSWQCERPRPTWGFPISYLHTFKGKWTPAILVLEFCISTIEISANPDCGSKTTIMGIFLCSHGDRSH